MKRSARTFVVIATVTAAGTLALAGASFAGWGFSGHHGGGHGYGPGGLGSRAMAMFQEFDLNKDGKLTQAEIDGARQNEMAQYDSDKNGRLSLKEFEGLWLDHMRERMVDQFQRLDADGDGIITDAEFQAPLAFIVARADRNGDGALSFDDMGRRWDKRHGGAKQNKEN